MTTRREPKKAAECRAGHPGKLKVCRSKGHDYRFLRFGRLGRCNRCGAEVLT